MPAARRHKKPTQRASLLVTCLVKNSTQRRAHSHSIITTKASAGKRVLRGSGGLVAFRIP